MTATEGAMDEAYGEDGRPRALYADLLAGLESVDLAALCEDVNSDLRARGMTFGDSPFHLDPIPRLIAAAEWDAMARGIVQRTRALTAFVADAYGAREIVSAGRLPQRVIETAECFEPSMQGVPVPAAGWVAGLDLVRGSDGGLRVLEDNLRTPSGLISVTVARDATQAHFPVALPPPRDPEPTFGLLRRALRAAAPGGGRDPVVVLLSDGEENPAWYEHRELARLLELPLLTAEDLTIRSGRLEARIGDRSRPVDVVYRRSDEDSLRDEHDRPTWLAELLLEPVRRGTLAVVNPFGGGLADDKLVHAYVEEMIRFYLGEEPLIESVPTYDLGDPEVCERVMPRLAELVVKPRAGLGGEDVVVGPQSERGESQRIERSVRLDPGDWIAQEVVTLSTHPTVVDGRLEPRHVDLRPFVIGGGRDAAVAPGALTRVALPEGELVVNSSQGGGGKDTWVLA